MTYGLRLAGTCLLLVLVAVGGPAYGGHGLMNAFGEVEWLPDPGRTPDQPDYALDRLLERSRLALTGLEQRSALAREIAREKLAEVDAMVRAGQREAAATAAAAYGDAIAAAAAAVAELEDAEREAQAADLAQALLEHQYLMSLNYLDLPRAARPVIGLVMETAQAHYDTLVASLPPAFKAAQFFKEEEVRWSWEMARQGDLQGL